MSYGFEFEVNVCSTRGLLCVTPVSLSLSPLSISPRYWMFDTSPNKRGGLVCLLALCVVV